MWSLIGVWLAHTAWAQDWVAPRRAGQSIVRNTDQDWQTLELLAGEQVEGQKASGVRLFFYETERQTAERAAPQIEDAYRELARKFEFVPKKRFDYVLYSTYQEFLRTNLFPVQEGVLGVTATQGYHMAIPYFGDHQTFFHTSTHELAHEFTIQKVRAAAKAADVWRDPLDAMPLWFIEGLAEWMAMGPIDGENALRVRDLVANPDVYTGHGLLGFWDDWPGYVLWTYQGGHARLTFLEEVYGPGTIVKILDLSPAMVTDQGLAARIQRFDRLLQEVTGDKPDRIADRFDDWIKRKTFDEWLQSEQSIGDIEPLDDVAGVPLSLDASPDGNLVAYRSIAPDTGRSALYVTDRRSSGSTVRIAADGRPGVESLHPIEPRNFDVADGRIAYVAEARGRDRVIVQQLRHEATRGEGPPPSEQPGDGEVKLPLKPPEPAEWWKIKLGKGKKTVISRALDKAKLSAVGSVALEPGGERVALVGLSSDGQRDLYVVTPGRSDLRRLTDDVYAERDVTWGKLPSGELALVYASDASADGKRQIFALTLDGDGVPRQLTAEDRDHASPVVLDDGTIVYSGMDGDKAELFAQYSGETVRLTDLATGAFEPSPGPEDGLWSMVLFRGRMQPALLRSRRMTALRDEAEPAAAGPAARFPEKDLSAAQPYRPYDLRNWGIDGGFAAIGAGQGGVFGQLYLSFSDRLRDHALVVLAQAYGTPELTDAQVIYYSERSRLSWGGGPIHSLRFRVDRTLQDSPFPFQSGERYYGGLVTVRYPLDRFVYLQADYSAGGVSYFLTPWVEAALQGSLQTTQGGTISEPPIPGRDLVREWEQANPYPRFQTETALRFGVDTTRFHPKTGPVAGTSVLLEATGGIQPFDDEVYASLRLDAQQYFPIPFLSGGNLGLRGSAATSGGGDYALGYWLSSYDTLRAVSFSDPALLGRHFWVTNAELQIPLDVLVRLAVASGIEGVAGIDFGGVADVVPELWENRVLDAALGTNFILGPLVLRLHFAKAIDIGAPLPVTSSRSGWVTNFSISWLQF